MPLRKDIHKVMVLGSGPIVIGQAAEFDYAGTQACRALREEGLEVVLVNSNPATIMTDKAMADKVYIEPMTVEAVQGDHQEGTPGLPAAQPRRPDRSEPRHGAVRGTASSKRWASSCSAQTRPPSHKAEDRQMFKDTMEKIGEPIIASKVVHTVEDAVEFHP